MKKRASLTTTPIQPHAHDPALRVPLVQQRSQDRLEQILTVTAHLIDEVGHEHVTTVEVAKRCGCSIGTVYRLFPDKFHIFDHLASRNIEQVLKLIPRAEMSAAEAATSLVGILERMQRTVPGYRDLRVGAEMRDMSRDGWGEIALALSKAVPDSSTDLLILAASLRGVDGVLAYDMASDARTELAKCILEHALTEG